VLPAAQVTACAASREGEIPGGAGPLHQVAGEPFKIDRSWHGLDHLGHDWSFPAMPQSPACRPVTPLATQSLPKASSLQLKPEQNCQLRAPTNTESRDDNPTRTAGTCALATH
jgi:hypothetical protein